MLAMHTVRDNIPDRCTETKVLTTWVVVGRNAIGRAVRRDRNANNGPKYGVDALGMVVGVSLGPAVPNSPV